MGNGLKVIKKEIKGYKDYWDLPRHLKIKLEKKIWGKIKKGTFRTGETSLTEKVEAIKKEYANEHPRHIKKD